MRLRGRSALRRGVQPEEGREEHVPVDAGATEGLRCVDFNSSG
ncbi:hypothetical protein TIFTF001_010796 [Ficus carica]|uniref:Uncharacterized protein n=1 Tax=Ficus carica TaxID=3494 RepID=A0AA88D4S4_FICCA|nr:hypothetical protein TIFTF001_010796 [Ficus carica]